MQDLRERGLAKITGDVVIDNTYFAPIADNRADFDAQPFRSYNVLPDALMVNFQTSRFTVNADRASARGRRSSSTRCRPTSCCKNQVRLGAGRCKRLRPRHRFDMPDRTRSEHAGRDAACFRSSCGSLLDHARDHDRAGLCIRNVSHAVDAVGRRDRRRRCAWQPLPPDARLLYRARLAAARRDHPPRQQVSRTT